MNNRVAPARIHRRTTENTTMTTPEESAERSLQDAADRVGKLEQEISDAEEAAGLDPAPDMPFDERLKRLRGT